MDLKKLKKAEDLVNVLLRDEPGTRSDDQLLLVRYWETQGLHLDPTARRFLLTNADAAETITRARREIMQHKKYVIPRVQQARMELADQVRKGI